MILTCGHCSKVFERDPSRASHGRGKHCSKACQYAAIKARPRIASSTSFTCLACKAAFTLLESRTRARLGGGKYCSRACRDTHRRGENHPLRVVGYRYDAKNYGTNWQAARRAALKRDAGRCQRCRASACALDIHHRVPIRLWAVPEDANHLSNLVTLCKPCHRAVDAALAKTLPREMNVAEARKADNGQDDEDERQVSLFRETGT